jgi:hypothetical protein
MALKCGGGMRNGKRKMKEREKIYERRKEEMENMKKEIRTDK